LIASYRDKYGPLGKIAVLAGQKVDRALRVNVWVMSCRAFSRRIEHRCLQELFERYNVEAIEFNYESTLKNAPLGEFLAEMLDESPTQQCRLSRDSFFKRWTETFHRVMEISNG
jgi:predicted enzyme involved in methoxymalonyl-ACP biosynthesis